MVPGRLAGRLPHHDSRSRPPMISSRSTTAPNPPDTASASTPGTITEVFLAFLKLGLTSFGGPIAHLGYFRDELITRRRWLDERGYADLVALCQFLPGPASSQEIGRASCRE